MFLHASTRSHRTVQLRNYALLAALFISLNIFIPCDGVAAANPQNAGQPPMTLPQVVNTMVARNEERANALESYQGRRTYTLVYQGFPSELRASLVVDMVYNAPNTKVFTVVSQSGPKWLVDRVLKRLVRTEKDAQQGKNRKAVDLNQENYNFSNLEYQPASDGCSYILSVEPKTPSKFLYRGRIWVNDRDFAVCRIQAEPAKNPSFWITSTKIAHTYEKVGEFWLPQKNRTMSKIRLGGVATLTIQYQNYRILASQTVNEHSVSFSWSR